MCYKSSGAERKISGVFSSELDPVKTNDYSGLQAAFANELYVDGGETKKEKVIKD